VEFLHRSANPGHRNLRLRRPGGLVGAASRSVRRRTGQWAAEYNAVRTLDCECGIPRRRCVLRHPPRGTVITVGPERTFWWPVQLRPRGVRLPHVLHAAEGDASGARVDILVRSVAAPLIRHVFHLLLRVREVLVCGEQ